VIGRRGGDGAAGDVPSMTMAGTARPLTRAWVVR